MSYLERMCRDWEPRLSEYVDDGLPPPERLALLGHLAGCQECMRAVEGLRTVRGRAAALDDRPLVRDLWPGIAERIGVSVPAAAPAARPAYHFSGWRRQLLAASLVAALAAGAARVWPAARTAGVQPDAGGVVLLAASQTEASYESAIADLVRVLEENRSTLDPRTVRVIEDNLAVIDQALARAREALARDPESDFLQRHLERTARQKLEVLQRVTTLTAAD